VSEFAQVVEFEVLNFYGDLCCPIERKTCNLTYAISLLYVRRSTWGRSRRRQRESSGNSQKSPWRGGKEEEGGATRGGRGAHHQEGGATAGARGLLGQDQGQGTWDWGLPSGAGGRAHSSGEMAGVGPRRWQRRPKGVREEEGVREHERITGKRRDPRPRSVRQRYRPFPIEDLPNPPEPELEMLRGRYLLPYLERVQAEARQEGAQVVSCSRSYPSKMGKEERGPIFGETGPSPHCAESYVLRCEGGVLALLCCPQP